MQDREIIELLMATEGDPQKIAQVHLSHRRALFWEYLNKRFVASAAIAGNVFSFVMAIVAAVAFFYLLVGQN